MSKPDLDIIHSHEAERMLQMVTKDFYDRSYLGLWIYEVIGREWDEMSAWARGLRDEIFPQTCTWSIAIWEWVYGFEPDDSLPLEMRRQRILAKIVGKKPINPEVIRQSVAALTGADVEVNDFVAPYRFEVIIHPRDKPFKYHSVWRLIRDIKPSHLGFEALLETNVDITIEIETAWNLLGYGLTGQYNAGTHPNINSRAELRDMLVDVITVGVGALFTPTPTGTKPQANTRFTQDTLEIIPDIGAIPFDAPYPMTGEASETGSHPHTQYIGANTDTGVSADIERVAAQIKPPLTGTQPQANTLYDETIAEIISDITAQGAVFPYDLAGTKPSPTEKLSAAAGGIVPTISAETYKISFRMCGTRFTGE